VNGGRSLPRSSITAPMSRRRGRVTRDQQRRRVERVPAPTVERHHSPQHLRRTPEQRLRIRPRVRQPLELCRARRKRSASKPAITRVPPPRRKPPTPGQPRPPRLLTAAATRRPPPPMGHCSQDATLTRSGEPSSRAARVTSRSVV
jgi:hypothetical protein